MPRAPFRILFVCTGNICRSPTAERLLRHALQAELGDRASRFAVTSAGTGALVGEPIQEYAAALLTHGGVDVAAFEARQLEPALVEKADLVLTMTRGHRAAAAEALPAAVPRLFTLREFARLASAAAAKAAGDAGDGSGDGSGADSSGRTDLVARARTLVRAAAGQRGLVRPDRPDEDDVPDPYGRGPEAYRLPFDLIHDAVGVVAPLLAGTGRG